MKAVSALLALAVAAPLALAGCSSARLGGAAGRVIEGDAVMVAQGEGWRVVGEGDAIPAGARVRTGLASAKVELSDGELWLGSSATVRLDDGEIELERGEVVVHRSASRLRWQAMQVTGDGTYRLSPGASPRVGVYAGEVTVRRPGEDRVVPPLRQLGLATRRLAADPAPLFYAVDDAWDRELLPRAIAFDEEIARLANGIDREYGTAPQPAAFYDSFAAVRPETVPVLAATARHADGAGNFGPPSDAMVTLFVASAVAAAKQLPIEEAIRRLADDRERGARWGLIAMERAIGLPELAAAVDLARERREIVVPGDNRSIGGRPPGPRPPAPSPTASPSPSPRPPGPSPSPSPSPPPPTEPVPPAPDGGVIERTLEGILG